MLRSLFVPFGTAATYSSSKRHANSQGLQVQLHALRLQVFSSFFIVDLECVKLCSK